MNRRDRIRRWWQLNRPYWVVLTGTLLFALGTVEIIDGSVLLQSLLITITGASVFTLGMIWNVIVNDQEYRAVTELHDRMRRGLHEEI